jgi:hypothetical protein
MSFDTNFISILLLLFVQEQTLNDRKISNVNDRLSEQKGALVNAIYKSEKKTNNNLTKTFDL